MRSSIKIISLILFTLTFAVSCSVTRTLPEDELLYTGSEVEIKDSGFLDKRSLKKDLEKVTVPEPNDKFLGFIPFQLWMYNLAGDSVPDKGFRHWLKYKAGTEPVTYENYHMQTSIQNISNVLLGRGYFDPVVEAREMVDDQKIQLKYIVDIEERYSIDTIIYEIEGEEAEIPFNQYQEKSLLKKEAPYNIETLKEERTRIAENLRNSGYFFFTDNNLIFKIDSNRNEKNLELYVALKENIPQQDLKKYRIGGIKVFPDYNISEEDPQYDTTVVDSIMFLSNSHRLDRDVINRSIMLRKGDYFSTNDYSATLNKLMGLGIFKYANISFERDTTTKSDTANYLNMNIYLTQKIPVSARIEVQGVTKSNNYTGPYLYLTYLDRNAFGSAESFEMNLSGGFETQLNKRNNLFSYEAGAEARLSFPRFIFPFVDFNRYLSKNYTPQTIVSLGYDIVSRVNYFTSNSLETSYGYNWQETPSKYHQLKIFSFNYSNLLRTTGEFEEILNENPLLKESFEERLILSIIYDYIFDEQLKEDEKFSTYFNFHTELAGNSLSLIDRALHGFDSDAITGHILGLQYTQFAKATTDLRLTYEFQEDLSIVNRYLIGAGLPYGNSTALPYNKQYFIGGVNSLRGFPYRSVGPGSFQPQDLDRFLFSHNGNFKMETNLELRFPIAGPVNGALFADAGNVWLWEESTEKPGAKFSFSDFHKEIAFNTGFGLRLDISFFVIRLDLGIPLRRPFEKNGKYWIDFRPFNKEWIGEYPVLNFAIGYPF